MKSTEKRTQKAQDFPHGHRGGHKKGEYKGEHREEDTFSPPSPFPLLFVIFATFQTKQSATFQTRKERFRKSNEQSKVYFSFAMTRKRTF